MHQNKEIYDNFHQFVLFLHNFHPINNNSDLINP